MHFISVVKILTHLSVDRPIRVAMGFFTKSLIEENFETMYFTSTALKIWVWRYILHRISRNAFCVVKLLI